MKKVLRLTESELIRIVKRIVESDDEIRSRMKRRFDGLQNLIQQEVDNEDEPESYSDAFEYASNILSYAVDEFISLPGNEYMADRYDEVLDYAKEEFGEDVMDVFRQLVGDDMGDFEDEDESPICISISVIFISWESKSNDFLLSYREAKKLGR